MHLADVTCAFTWREDGTSTTSAKSEDFLKTAAAVHQRYAAESSRDPGVADAQRRFLEQLRTRSQKAGPLCSIIIPVWNKAELTRQCLTKLAEATRGIDYEVVIVDNGSTDETPAFLRRLSGDVRIVTNAENRGFAKACNQGAALAKGRYLVFLNNDTIPLPGWLNALVDEVETHAEVAVVGSKLLYEDGTVQHAGVAFSWTWSTPYHIYRGVSRQAPMVGRRRELQAVTGACMLIRREQFEAVGGFDEDYRNGFEDIDLCLKVRERGGRIVYQPKSVLYHLESQTPGRKDHDRANAKRLCGRWGHKWWLSDEYMIYTEDGLAWRGRKENGTWRHSLERFSDRQDQARWERVSRVQALTHRGDAADLPALKHLLADVDEWPNDQQVLHWAASVCKRLNESASEEAFWKRALIIEEVPDGRAALARLALEHGRFDEAGEHLRVLMTHHPRHGEGWLIQGVLAMQRHAYEEAVSAFESALQNGADFRKSRLGCGMAEMGQGYADRAWNRFIEILTAHADDAETLHWLLRAGTALERWEELARFVGLYTKRNPADLSARFALAGVYVRLGRWDAAQREYEAVRLLNPAYEGLDQLAHALAGTEACSTSHGH
jgi:GT2 family glycosyltransferase/tetratricopeptide (TPR) repeat protein